MAEEIIVKVIFDTRDSARKVERDFEAQKKALEAKELAHQRRLEAIHLQSGARLQQIEARRQAQIDLIRERATQREIQRQRQLESSVRSSSIGTVAAITAIAAAAGAAAVAMKKFADISIQAAIDVNRQVNVLKALTGSAEAAEKRFAALFALAQKTPGLTTNLAATLDAQLRVFGVAERTIDRLLPAIGRLNAISPLSDPRQFVNNFTQLITQNFERQDLKELVGQSPIAGLLIKEIFDVDNPTNAAAIRAAAKRLGITTVERLAEEFAEAAATNSALRNATESFAAQFDKLQDRITVALAPIGEEMLRVLLPAFKEFVELLERDLPKVTALLRDNRDEFLAVASAIVTMAGAVGQLIAEFNKLDQKFGIIRALTLLAIGITSPGSTGAALAAFDVLDERKRQLSLDPLARRRLAAAQGDLSLTPTDEELRAFAISQGDLSLLASLPPAPRVPGAAGGGGGTGGGGTARISAAQRERDREIKDLLRKQVESLVERREQDLKDFDELNRLLQVALVEEEGRLQGVAGRPAQLAAFSAAQAERIRQIELEDARLAQNTAEKAAKELAKLPPILSDSERFMRGFAEATQTAGDAFEQFGADVARAFTSVRDLFNGLKRAVLDFFNNLIGSALQNLVRGVLGPIFGGGGGGGGNFFGNLFRGGGPSAPASVSGGNLSSSISSLAGSVPGVGSVFRATGGGAAASGGGFSFGGLGSSFAAAAPLLGLSLGAGLGGQSTAGNILGGIGGALAGSAKSLLGLGSIAGIASLFAAPALLIGGFFLGRAKQRRNDEELSGQFLTQALQGIQELAAGVASGQIPATQARGIFDTQILGVFKQQIGSLKTKSVRESRLKNQVRDLERNYQDVVGPAIQRAADAARAASIDRRLIPEFATGGTTRGGLAFLHPGEKVLNLQQQSAVRAMAGVNVFERAGVPGVRQGVNAFPHGGTMGAGSLPIVIENLTVSLLVGKDDATRIVVTGGNTPQGRGVTVKNVQVARTNREL